jgi:hypothetical protein
MRRRLAGILRQGGDLPSGRREFRLGHLPHRQGDPPDRVHQGDVGVDLLAGAFVRLVQARTTRRASSCSRVSPRSVRIRSSARRRTIGCGDWSPAAPGPGQDPQVVAVAGAELRPHLVPEVGVDRREVLHLLRRAGDVDRRGQELPVAVPEEQHLDAVVFAGFEVAEVRRIGAAVHLRMPIGVDGAPVLRHDGVSQAPAHEARPRASQASAAASATRSTRKSTYSAGRMIPSGGRS